MAQLLVRNLPEEVKERLKRRAEANGRSLEAEVRDILAQTPPLPTRTKAKKEGAGTALAKQLKKIKVSDETWKSFEENLKAVRRDWRPRKIDFGS